MNNRAIQPLPLLLALASVTAAGQSLRELAEPRHVLMGAAHNGSFTDPAYLSTMAREYNQIQAENAMKFGPLHPAMDTYNFAPADAIVNYAAQNGMRMRGHVLVWHSQNPAWLINGNFAPSQLSEILHQHISAVAARYQGKVYAWDVVNEAFNANGSLRDTIWYDQPGIGLPGTAYIEQAFRWAHEADPNAVLFYNDFGAEWVNAKSDAIYRMAVDFLERGVPLGGIGLQCHFTAGNAANLPGIDANIKRLTSLGLQVQITELDVRLPVDANGNASAADLAAQAGLYGQLASACFQYALCTAIQTWGFTDKSSWIPGTYPGFGAALPFNSSFQPKAAYNTLQTALSMAADMTRPALPAPVPRPQITASAMVNAASYEDNSIAPGEIVVLFGASPGPPTLVASRPDATGKLPAALAETRLMFDGTTAPMLYAEHGQMSAIVPFGLSGHQQAAVQYEYQGIQSNSVTIPVIASKPGLFTLDASGKGQASALDAAYNPVTRAAPISPGGVLLLYLTGAGQTNPAGTDGIVSSQAPFPTPQAKVTASVAGIDALVLYAGGAADLVQGVIQVNLQVPDAVPSGDQPVVVTVGGSSSSMQVTVAVR